MVSMYPKGYKRSNASIGLGLLTRGYWLRLVIRAAFVGRSITLGVSVIGAEGGNGSHLKRFVRSFRKRIGVQPECAGCDGRIKSGGLANARYAATLSLSPSARITFSTVANSGFARAKAPCKDSPDLGLAIPHRRRGDRSIAAAFAGACCTGVLPKGVRCAVLRLPRSGK